MLLENVTRKIRKKVITKDPKTPEKIGKFSFLEDKSCKGVNPFYSINNEYKFKKY